MASFLGFFSALMFLSVPVSSQLNEFYFPGFGNLTTNLTLTGVSVIERNGVLRLTNETTLQSGQAIYGSPFHFKNSTNGQAFSFSTSFALIIFSENYPTFGGNRLAFTISPSKPLNGLSAAYLGNLNSSNKGNFSNRLFAVEFEAVESPEFGDVNGNHVGIRIKSGISDASSTAFNFTDSSTNQNLDLDSGKRMVAWIDYDAAEKLVNVTISPNPSKPRWPVLSSHIDLSSYLDEFMYIGFSASTGTLVSSHYILGWSFKINGSAQALNLTSLPYPSILRSVNKRRPTVLARVLEWTGILVATAMTLIALIFWGIFFFIIWRRLRIEEKFLFDLMSEAKELEIDGKKGFNLKVYKVSSIKIATNNFSSKNKLGEGGFGPVYKGLLLDGQEIAIKRLSRRSKQGEVEFKNELIIVAKLQHNNLVRLLGFCIQGDEKILVYEYMPNKSLDSYLFDESRRKAFDWKKYLNIIEEIAHGLLYLHKYSRLRIIHRDLKASNILLDKSMNPKISDFGMAKIFTSEAEANTKRIAGTRGYMAPEYTITGLLSEKSDVFSFGILVLEIISGRRSNNSIFYLNHPLNLIGYAWELWKEGVALELMNPTLRNSCCEDQVLRCINLALLCVEYNPVDRPCMSSVITMLASEGVELPPPKQPAFSIERKITGDNLSGMNKAQICTINNLTISEMDAR